MTKKKQTKKKTQRKTKKFSEVLHQVKLPMSINADGWETDLNFLPCSYADGVTHETKTTKIKRSKAGIYTAVYDESSQNVEIWYEGWGAGSTTVMNLEEFKKFHTCIDQLYNALVEFH